MQLTRYAVLLALVIIIVTTGLVGGHFGYTVHGVPQGGGVLQGSNPGIVGFFDWVWDSIVFLFNMTTFQVDGMPVFISAVFLVMSVMMFFLIISLVRGSEG